MRVRWVRAAAGYVGAVVGAGFASGREIQHFFVANGVWGLVGAGMAGALFALVGATVLRIVVRGRIRHYGALLRALCGSWFGAAFDRLGTLVLGVGLVVVLAGGGALGGSVGGWPRLMGMLVLAAVLGGTELLGRAVHATVNLTVVPLIALTCALAALAPGARGAVVALHGSLPWVLAAVLYVAYNLVLGIAGLSVSADPDLAPAEATLAGVVGGAVLGLLCASIAWVLRTGAGVHAELPLGAVLAPGHWRTVGYPATLFLALWTTGAATVRALSERLGRGRSWVGLAAILAALPFASFGLVGLVATVYPLLGLVGLPLVVGVFVAAVREFGPRARDAWCGRPVER